MRREVNSIVTVSRNALDKQDKKTYREGVDKEIFNTEHHLDFPADVHPLWAIIQPIKDANNQFPPTPYTHEEINFWVPSVRHMDEELAKKARLNKPDNTPGLHVHIVKQPHETGVLTNRLNTSIRTMLNAEHNISYVGFTHGVLPHLAEIYNDPLLRPGKKCSMTTAIVGGTDGNDIHSTRVLTPVPDWVFHTDLVIAHDDIGDTMAALAAFTELVHSRKLSHAYDEAYVNRFTENNVSTHDRLADYTRLITSMQESGVIAAIPFYKNKEFIEGMTQTLAQTDNQWYSYWRVHQTPLFQHHQLFPPEWLMGEGLDTSITMALIRDRISNDILSHPAVSPLFEHTRESKLRIGSTIKGLIALQWYPEDERRAYNDLVSWIAAHIEERLRLSIQASEITQ